MERLAHLGGLYNRQMLSHQIESRINFDVGFSIIIITLCIGGAMRETICKAEKME